ncbi:MAG: hypothetical protein ACRDD1_00665, partial [Planctomycetia bacterium]
MDFMLFEFQRLNGTTWFYMSLLLSLVVYFSFTRIFSLRNWDLVTVLLLAPGLLATHRIDRQIRGLDEEQRGRSTVIAVADLQPAPPAEEKSTEKEAAKNEPRRIDPAVVAAEPPAAGFGKPREILQVGYFWLFAVSAYFIVRCVADLFLVRRPRIEPNLNAGGLVLLGVALFGFLVYEVMVKEPDPAGRESARAAARLMNGPALERTPPAAGDRTPGAALSAVPLVAVQVLVAEQLTPAGRPPQYEIEIGVARSIAILCHLAIVAALFLIGWRHFGSATTGVGLATLYLLLPATALHVEKIDHLLPAAFLTWAVYWYRRPVLVGVAFGLAGVFFFPLVLVPLWAGFYWNRGAKRFLLSFALVTGALW